MGESCLRIYFAQQDVKVEHATSVWFMLAFLNYAALCWFESIFGLRTRDIVFYLIFTKVLRWQEAVIYCEKGDSHN